MNGIFLLMGSNLGDRLKHLANAIEKLEQRNIIIDSRSSIYETEPWGKDDQPWFLNLVVKVRTDWTPSDLLNHCLLVENEMGRKRDEKWGPRLIDIDILYFDDQVVAENGLQVPHPGLPNRKFTLMPMVELAGGSLHPVFKKSQIELLMECEDNMAVNKTKLAVP